MYGIILELRCRCNWTPILTLSKLHIVLNGITVALYIISFQLQYRTTQIQFVIKSLPLNKHLIRSNQLLIISTAKCKGYTILRSGKWQYIIINILSPRYTSCPKTQNITQHKHIKRARFIVTSVLPVVTSRFISSLYFHSHFRLQAIHISFQKKLKIGNHRECCTSIFRWTLAKYILPRMSWTHFSKDKLSQKKAIARSSQNL